MSDQLISDSPSSVSRKTYIKPAITHELNLETRAGSPPPTVRPPIDPQIDPLGIDPKAPR